MKRKNKTVVLIGAGNLGSRHLQGLAKVSLPLNIEVVDPFTDSLKVAEERLKQIPTHINHKVSFFQNLDLISKGIDLAIVATNSNSRRKATEKLLSKSQVEYLLLEKILFDKKTDYEFINKLVSKKVKKTWVDFSMRTMPFYRELQGKLKGPVQMVVSGGQFGLITNAIHFVDYVSYLTGSFDFNVETIGLSKKIIESKRKGFLELTGTLSVHFKNGSSGLFACYPTGDAPFQIEIISDNFRCISKESERKAWISEAKNNWKWEEITSEIPYQSDMTNLIAEQILRKGSCNLTEYSQATKTHLQFLESLLKFLNQNSRKKYNYYPFT